MGEAETAALREALRELPYRIEAQNNLLRGAFDVLEGHGGHLAGCTSMDGPCTCGWFPEIAHLRRQLAKVGYINPDPLRDALREALDVDRLGWALGPHPQDPELRRARAEAIAAAYADTAEYEAWLRDWDVVATEHITDGAPCWCQPDAIHDGSDGAIVIHKDNKA